ncbi:MAG: DCL family protein [Flavobacteriaceae bacterium]|jgi:hypothetical protein|nr:DCL family protein [Flavobacteriaceae bacterium]
MREPIQIGTLSFKSKKEALTHFKQILNSYDFGETLNANDFNEVYELLKTHEKVKEKIGVGIKEIKVDVIRSKTKCFYLIRNDLTIESFSYTRRINGGFNAKTKFSRACRNIINEDLRNVKLEYFRQNSKNGQVKCQETGELCKWEELNIDHRQPNTFSMILERFIEVNNIDINKIEYEEIIDSVYTLKNKKLAEDFRKYHKDKANLRLVKKGKNLGRSHQVKTTKQKKDLTIK